eukprot:GHVN01097140.1.p1 GENE.GHVN01097140.1~~GHVN01097140.1.p1  ORF type:complete len:107 (-),score=8.21 GHVN01097140.1:383-703(-)
MLKTTDDDDDDDEQYLVTKRCGHMQRRGADNWIAPQPRTTDRRMLLGATGETMIKLGDGTRLERIKPKRKMDTLIHFSVVMVSCDLTWFLRDSCFSLSPSSRRNLI